jgi:membrane protein
MAADAENSDAAPRSVWRVARDTAWRLVVSTVGICFRNRVTGLAAEAAFFALLSLPPLIFGLVGSIGYVFDRFSEAQISDFRANITDLALRAFTEETVDKIINPTIDDVLSGPRVDVISIGFVLALWSGSRALNVFVDTITIMYGLNGHRGIVRTRVLSFTLYVLGLVTGIVTIPLVLAGPGLVDEAVDERFDWLVSLYWPIVLILCICFLALLYHVSVPVRTSWRYNLPGATLTLLVWIVGSYVLRWVLVVTAAESTSIYGPLAAPIAMMLWLYLVSIAILIGAALNASFDRIWPERETAEARQVILRRLGLDGMMSRLRRDDSDDAAAEAAADDAEAARTSGAARDVSDAESHRDTRTERPAAASDAAAVPGPVTEPPESGVRR